MAEQIEATIIALLFGVPLALCGLYFAFYFVRVFEGLFRELDEWMRGK